MDKNSFNRVLKPQYGFAAASSLGIAYWLNDTYLVEEHLASYDSYCKKIELSKIQAFTYMVTLWNRIVVLCLSALIALMISMMAIGGSDWGVGLYVGVVFTLILTAGVIVKLRQGSSCVIYIHTAVGSRALEGIRNTTRAIKFFAEVNKAIRNIQGEVDVDRISANIEETEKIISRITVSNRGKRKRGKKVSKEVK